MSIFFFLFYVFRVRRNLICSLFLLVVQFLLLLWVWLLLWLLWLWFILRLESEFSQGFNFISDRMNIILSEYSIRIRFLDKFMNFKKEFECTWSRTGFESEALSNYAFQEYFELHAQRINFEASRGLLLLLRHIFSFHLL